MEVQGAAVSALALRVVLSAFGPGLLEGTGPRVRRTPLPP